MFEQERVLVRIQQYFLKDPQIIVCLLAGSFGKGTNDQYSDIDLFLIFRDDDSRELAFSRRKDFVKQLLPYVPVKSFDASHIRPYFHIALYGNGAKVDFLYETIKMEPAFYLREVRILKDENQWAEGFLKRCAQQPQKDQVASITSEALSDLDSRFWVMFMDAYRHLLRGEHDKPFSIYLQLQSFTLPVLMDLLPPGDPDRKALAELFFKNESNANLAHIRNLMMSYLHARDTIIDRHQLAFTPDRVFENNLKKKIGL